MSSMDYKMSIFNKVKDLIIEYAEENDTVESIILIENKLVKGLTNLECDGAINHWCRFNVEDRSEYIISLDWE